MKNRANVQAAAGYVGVAFLVIGVLGFVPGAVTDYAELNFWEHDSYAQLFDTFQVSILHNVVHLLYGAAGLALARTFAGARWYLIGGGALYLVAWIYGLAVDAGGRANFVPFDRADNWLHFVIGAGMIALSIAATRGPLADHLTLAGRYR